MVASGVCHSDWTYINGHYENDVFPAIMGHEGGGIVESVGEGVTTVKPGKCPGVIPGRARLFESRLALIYD